MSAHSQNLSITDVQKRISELDAIVENINALKAERDDLKRALPALQSLVHKGSAAAGAGTHHEGDVAAKAKPYSPKPGTNVGRLYQIICEHPEGISEKQIIEESAKTGTPFKHSSVSSQLSQLRKRKIIRKMKGLYFPR